MPTNLKSLLSRSRSRNDLKQAQQGNGSKSPSSNDKDKGQPEGTQSQSSPTSPTTAEENEPSSFQIHDFSIGSSSNILGKQSSSNSHSLFSLPGSSSSSSSSPNHHNIVHETSKSHPVTPQHNFPNSSTPARSSMRKCETVLALTSTPIPNTNGTTTSSSKICKGMKDRILSTSSSALNSILHSSSKTTTKLFGGFKLGSSSGNPSSQINNPCPGATMHQNNMGTNGSHNSLVVCNCNCNCQPPLTPMNRLRRNGSLKTQMHSSNMNMTLTRTSSVTSVRSDDDGFGYGGGMEAGSPEELIQCRLCLSSIKWGETLQIEACSCRYCRDCVEAYVTFEIGEGATDIACPDATCEKQGVLSLSEISTIVPSQLLEKYHKFQLYKEVETNSQLMWCPSPGCETICTVYDSTTNGFEPKIPTIQCTRCQHIWCTQCKLPIHPNQSCDAYRQKLINSGKLSIIDEEPFAAYDSIKKCPFCHVPIEKDSGCAQMMCKRCKHVFCWYCLTSLDDDFLLRHYDKGPCKNKLGHSRASVVWHRTQVIGIFAGFGLLVLLASPLLILAAPCLLCCRCRYCTDHLDSSSTDDNPELL